MKLQGNRLIVLITAISLGWFAASIWRSARDREQAAQIQQQIVKSQQDFLEKVFQNTPHAN